MSFSKTYLEKYGWKEGDGLGKNQTGINKPIKASLKFNKEGFGYIPSVQYTNSWWIKQYNEALQTSSLDEQKDQNQSENEENNNEHNLKRKRKKKLKKLKPEDLFEACGGRTAHKGARHGLKQSGKLQRLEEQEQLLFQKLHNNNKS